MNIISNIASEESKSRRRNCMKRDWSVLIGVCQPAGSNTNMEEGDCMPDGAISARKERSAFSYLVLPCPSGESAYG
jgi:hypothetical protein